MNFSIKKLTRYCESMSTPEDKTLAELNRETNLKTLAPQMISGHLQGQLLTMVSQMIRPKSILEIGTFTGYAAICLAKGVQQGGQLHSIEANEELEYIIRNAIEKAGFNDRIKLHIGDAKTIVEDMDTSFDLIFIDAGKRDYSFYYDLVFDKLNSGGFILADNVLWNGKVVQGQEYHDKDTKMLHDFNTKIMKDPRVENMILPIRDGLMMIRKI